MWFHLPISVTSNIGAVKKLLWKELTEKRKIELKKTPNDYMFRVDGDDFLEDESEKISSCSYMLFCEKINIRPTLILVEKTQVRMVVMATE